MTQPILVTYATRAGSTAGVAEAIGKALTERGAEVEVRPMQDVHDLSPYQAVIAGSAIQNRQWLPEALHFVQLHRVALSKVPFAAFLVCMTLTIRNGQYRDQVAEWLQPVRALLRPVSEGLFSGVLDLRKIPSWSDRFKFRVSVLLGVWTEGDHRDWEAIRSWAQETHRRLTH
jgi:menaquinone-dependent protoporphyrinogen oxidase